MSFPVLDLPAFRRLSTLPSEYIQHVEDRDPGFCAEQIGRITSLIDARLRKLYGNNGRRSGWPFGKAPAPFASAGTSPPSIALSGQPTVGSIELVLQITTGGPLGTAIAQWSQDAGTSWTKDIVSAASVVLGATGITAAFGAGTYSTDNLYRADTPVPRIIIGWIVDLLNVRVVRKHRAAYANEKGVKDLDEEAARALEQIEEAANGNTGLFDIPVNDDDASNSNQTTGGILAYSESSPFVSADRQEAIGRAQDGLDYGRFGGGFCP